VVGQPAGPPACPTARQVTIFNSFCCDGLAWPGLFLASQRWGWAKTGQTSPFWYPYLFVVFSSFLMQVLQWKWKEECYATFGKNMLMTMMLLPRFHANVNNHVLKVLTSKVDYVEALI